MERLDIVVYRQFFQKKMYRKQTNKYTLVNIIYSYFLYFYFEYEEIELFHNNREMYVMAEF